MRNLSQNDRDLPKCGKLVAKEGEGSDLSLSGSQVSLVSRPRSVMGKASSRALSVSGPRVRRPMSAVPTMSFTEISRDKRRPYSADSQLLLSSCHQKRNKLSACFSLSADPMGLVHHDVETDGDVDFSSSTLVSSQLSDQLGGAWMELEMRGLYLGHSAAAPNWSCTDNGSDLLCCSDVSDDRARSEKSLGERIQAMARDHDRPLCAPAAEEKAPEGANRKLDKYKCDDDPKKMSTQELHFRMVESGLISTSSQQHSVAYETKVSSDVSRYESHYSCHSVKPHVLASQCKADMQGRNGEELSSQKDSLRPEPISTEFWKQPLGFLQGVTKSDCIDQITFPKEHDVDSLEGDLGCTALDAERSEMSRPPSLPNCMEQEGGKHSHWPNGDLGPVRFQQWINDGCKSSGLIANGGCVPSTYFSNVRSSHIQSDKKTVDLDCTIEEVSTDSEYSKVYGSLNSQAEKECSYSDLSMNPSVLKSKMNASIEDDTKRVSLKETPKATSDHDHVPKEDNAILDAEDHGMCGTVLAQEPELLTKHCGQMKNSKSWYSSPLQLSNKQADKMKLDEKNVKKSNGVFKEHPDPKFASTSKPNSPKSTSISCPTNDCKKNQNQQSHLGTKRKNEAKGNGSGRRCGKSPSSHRSFGQPKEEMLPGETQPELLSWMAMCDNELGDKAKQDHNQLQKEFCLEGEAVPPFPSSESKHSDSPYNEIMTILRVLEEKEDESSLIKILNRRCDLRTSLDPAAVDTKPILSHGGSSTPSMSQTNSTETEAPAPACSMAPSDIAKVTSKVSSELNHVVQVDTIHNTPKSSPVPCVVEDGASEPSVQGELRDLLTFLDAVDQSCSSVLQPKLPSNPRASPRPPSATEDPHNLEELLLMGRSELAQEIVSLRLALEDRDATINLLRSALREQKDSQVRQNAAHKSELDNQMRQVKAECEAVIKRHQKFIDQLISDKASLSKRCEALVQDAKECDEKHAKSLTNLEEKHKVEMQRVKDITTATEKLKRERWVENKTQKIKELTVRGLEPELTRLTSQHEQEMSALRTLHAQELEQMEVRAARRASQQMEALREQLVQEKEDALARERDMLRQRMEKQQLLYEEEGAEQRRRLVAEVRREQDRLATLESRLEVQFEERKRSLEREAEQERDRVRRDYTDKLNEMHRKQQNEILQFREALKAEKEAWADTYQQQQKQALIQTTNEIRDQLKRERDREIEVVIERLENEATISREEKEKAAENRLRRVREQLTSELRDVESALKTLKEKHTELRVQLQEKEDKLVSSEALNRSLHTQLVETRKIADQLSAERADLKQTLQSELSNEMECIRQQLSDQHLRHQQQLQILAEQSERERQTHQQELQQLFDRVKLAIAKKEEVVKVAKAKQKAAEEQNSHLQALLDHRRKESLLP